MKRVFVPNEVEQYCNSIGCERGKIYAVNPDIEKDKINLAMIHVFERKFKKGESIEQINVYREIVKDAKKQVYTEFDKIYQDNIHKEIAALHKKNIIREELAMSGWIVATVFILIFILRTL